MKRFYHSFSSLFRSGMTPLHFAALNGHEDTVRIILQVANVQVIWSKDAVGRTPFKLAKYMGYSNICEIMLQCLSEQG